MSAHVWRPAFLVFSGFLGAKCAFAENYRLRAGRLHGIRRLALRHASRSPPVEAPESAASPRDNPNRGRVRPATTADPRNVRFSGPSREHRADTTHSQPGDAASSDFQRRPKQSTLLETKDVYIPDCSGSISLLSQIWPFLRAGDSGGSWHPTWFVLSAKPCASRGSAPDQVLPDASAVRRVRR